MCRALRLLLALSFLPAARAEPRLHALFSDRMVLQRDKPVPVWGWAEAEAAVTVSFAGVSRSTHADAAGRWRVELPPLAADATPRDLGVESGSRLTVRDVVVGDVWLCSGQSNMSIGLGHFRARPEVEGDIRAADFPLLRHFAVPEHFATAPQEEVKARWTVCSPRTADGFSAVAFYFGRRLHRETGVPVGLIRAAKGSTGIEMWMSAETIAATPALAPLAARMRDALGAWEPLRARAVSEGLNPGDTGFPEHPFGEKLRAPRCVTLYQGMILPLAPCALRGIVWYQGENNAGRADGAADYTGAQAALASSWRALFRDERLPFLYVQLPNFRDPAEHGGAGGSWALFREAQARGLAVPRTGMAVAIDVGEAGDIHPANKFDVGERLALQALRVAHDRADVVADGPVFREVTAVPGGLAVRFDVPGGGLMAGRKDGRKPVVEASVLSGFAVAGADKVWHPAQAVIRGDAVDVRSTNVPAPAHVRYAFADNPAGANLYSRAGLPARPFRTDTW